MDQIPFGIIVSIAQYLDIRSFLNLTETCKEYKKLNERGDLWNFFQRKDFPLFQHNLITKERYIEIYKFRKIKTNKIVYLDF